MFSSALCLLLTFPCYRKTSAWLQTNFRFCDDRNLPGGDIDPALKAANDIPTLLSFIDPAMDGATLACEIDGVSVQDLGTYRVRSSVFYIVNLPEDNIYVPAFGLPGAASQARRF